MTAEESVRLRRRVDKLEQDLHMLMLQMRDMMRASMAQAEAGAHLSKLNHRLSDHNAMLMGRDAAEHREQLEHKIDKKEGAQ